MIVGSADRVGSRMVAADVRRRILARKTLPHFRLVTAAAAALATILELILDRGTGAQRALRTSAPGSHLCCVRFSCSCLVAQFNDFISKVEGFASA